MSARKAYTLVECIVVIALASATLTTLAIALHGMFVSKQRIDDELRCDADRARLAIQFRRDVHEAIVDTLEITGDEATMAFDMAGRREATYTISPRRIERLVKQDEKVMHRESYRLPPATQAHWTTEQSDGAQIVSLRIDPSPKKPGAAFSPQAMRIDAAASLIHLEHTPTREVDNAPD
jgi:type II secretory pathway pseudopilin PulG